ncbi:expressed unknown protein [Seminavis robusta]|uniref:Uncharacterized protein n=1 Tax=Seminavis robusta TaxID=568900 RepID=A0A9N8DNY5_9STRA|nr:expressed unknown protein [Seminavis robusta]|eukprot:Sro267_g103550.1 n/a (217) ;mRNA; r:73519-74372
MGRCFIIVASTVVAFFIALCICRRTLRNHQASVENSVQTERRDKEYSLTGESDVGLDNCAEEASTYHRAKLFFPTLDLTFEDATEYQCNKWDYQLRGWSSPTVRIKDIVKDHVKRELTAMSSEEKEHLLKLENAVAFCLKIGMNKDVVEMKFEAAHQLDHDNPFGEVNDCIQDGARVDRIAELIKQLPPENGFALNDDENADEIDDSKYHLLYTWG